MKNCGQSSIGLCSWSLQKELPQVAEVMSALGVDHVHLGPVTHANRQECLDLQKKHNWQISSTMIGFPQEDYSTLDAIKQTGGIVPDDCWEKNRDLFQQALEVTADLGIGYLSMHAGFIDESNADYARKIHDRIRLLADAAAAKNITLLLETGQETAGDLKHFLETLNHPQLAVNFDPANMILYGKGDPIEAVRTLGPWIKHVHIKDANRSDVPGQWGAEVPWGEGQVNAAAFLGVLDEIGYAGALAIEREAGDDRAGDIKQAIDRLVASR